ncbi:MAG: cytochrome b/b6 domain-containing protein, partial [Deltaproteobacteria bacterium]|nr:cytochrome b/b6 domain-containing protein [Deltaproteobacteria bacterium]
MDGDNLRRDPRTLSTGEFLRRPDHRLGGAACAACHDAAAAHPDLPFRERHLEVLACEACHVTDLAAPAARAVDATVLTPAGGPRLEIRGVEDPTGDPDTWFSTGYRPFLLHEAGDGDGRFAPYNVLARWEWVDGTGEPVPPELLARAWKTTAGDYHPELVQLLDRDRDGLLAVEELLLDTPERAAAVAGRLAALGVREPRIRGLLEAHPLHHGVAGGPWAEGRCRSCHGHDSRLAEDIPLSETLPGGMAPVPAAGVAELLGGRELVRQGDGLVIRGSALAEDHYVPGLSRSWTGTAGFLFFALTLLGVTLHALMRILAARRRGSAPVIHGLRREYLYNAYERLWHWVMAFSVLVLIATGLRIHLPAAAAPLSFEAAVFVHNMVAVVLLLNAFLALFYHLATSEIRQFIPEGAGFAARLRAQARYYLHGIFRGASHPPGRSRQRKLNPLQQVTYAVLLNVLFPLQAVTGVLLWVAGVRPDLLRPLGGLSLLLPLHHLGSWLFLSFLVAHVYLTTTGHTPLAHVRAMISGWD